MAFKIKNTAERLPHVYKGATIYFHRIPYTRQNELRHACTERGEVNNEQLMLLAAQDATDGWDAKVLDADDQPLPVPTAATPELWREKIAAIVSVFDTQLIVELASLGFSDDPETVRKNWQPSSGVSSASTSQAPDGSLPVATADATGGTNGSLSPATQADSLPASTGTP